MHQIFMTIYAPICPIIPDDLISLYLWRLYILGMNVCIYINEYTYICIVSKFRENIYKSDIQLSFELYGHSIYLWVFGLK